MRPLGCWASPFRVKGKVEVFFFSDIPSCLVLPSNDPTRNLTVCTQTGDFAVLTSCPCFSPRAFRIAGKRTLCEMLRPDTAEMSAEEQVSLQPPESVEIAFRRRFLSSLSSGNVANGAPAGQREATKIGETAVFPEFGTVSASFQRGFDDNGCVLKGFLYENTISIWQTPCFCVFFVKTR